METLELPVEEELDEVSVWPEIPPVDFAEQEMDIVAFELWREASCLDDTAGETDLATYSVLR